MHIVSKEYQDIISNPYISNPYEINCLLEVINQEAQQQATVQNEMLEYYLTNLDGVFVNETIEMPYATCEENYNRLDGTFFFVPKKAQDTYAYQALIGSKVSDEANTIDQSFYIHFKNELTYEVKGLCLHFEYAYPVLFAIEDEDGTELYRFENNQKVFKSNEVFTFHKGMRIHILKMNKPNHRCRISYIEFGMYVELNNEDVVSMSYRQQIHPLSNACYISDMSITCVNQNGEYDTENPSSVINFLEKLQDIKISLSLPLKVGKETLPIASLYLNEWSSNRKEVCFKAVDIFTFLESTYYQKNYELNKDAYVLCEEVLLDAGISNYEIATELHEIRIDNPIPKSTHKEVLQLLCNAMHCVFYQNRNGKVIICPSTYAQKSISITKEDMLDIAVGTKLDQVKQLEVMYTKYYQNEELEQISKGTYEKGNALIEFSNPAVGLQVVGNQVELLESGPYFALINVLSEGEVILNGYKLQESKQRCMYTLHERGVIKTVDNILVSSKQMAEKHWEWMKAFIASDRTYETSIRGRMELDVLDTIGLANDFNPNLNIQVEDYTLSFTGSLQGKLQGRKVVS